MCRGQGNTLSYYISSSYYKVALSELESVLGLAFHWAGLVQLQTC